MSGGSGKQGGDRDESRRSDDSHPAKTLYRTAHNLMQRREFDEAKQGFERYVANYPKGDNITNALFWLGELSLVVAPPSLAQAKQSFSRIVNDYPELQTHAHGAVQDGEDLSQSGQRRPGQGLAQTGHPGNTESPAATPSSWRRAT